MARKCVVCKNYIPEGEPFKTLHLVQGPVKEDTVYVHAACYVPKLLEQESIKLEDTNI